MSSRIDNGWGESGLVEMMGPIRRCSLGKICVLEGGQWAKRMWAQGDIMGLEEEAFPRENMG
jgi:hypothetical protein